LLSVIRQFEKKQVEAAMRLFVCWSVRFLIVGGGRSGGAEESSAEIAKKVTDGAIKTTSQLADAMKKVVPTDPEFESAFATARVTDNNLARYYLRAMELKRKGNPEPEWIPNEDIVINLEHVLPENPASTGPHSIRTQRNSTTPESATWCYCKRARIL
jgi:hypothetical protein